MKIDSNKAKIIGLTALFISNLMAFILMYLMPENFEIYWYGMGMLLLDAICAGIWLIVI